MPDNIFQTLGIPEPVTAEGVADFINDCTEFRCVAAITNCYACHIAVIEAYAAMRAQEAREEMFAVFSPECRRGVLSDHGCPGTTNTAPQEERRFLGAIHLDDSGTLFITDPGVLDRMRNKAHELVREILMDFSRIDEHELLIGDTSGQSSGMAFITSTPSGTPVEIYGIYDEMNQLIKLELIPTKNNPTE